MTLYLIKDERARISVIVAEGDRVVQEQETRSYYFIREHFKVLGKRLALDTLTAEAQAVLVPNIEGRE
jgi:hypothetical protein